MNQSWPVTSSLQYQASSPVRIVLRHGMTPTTQCDTALPGDTARSIIAERWPALARHLATVQPFTALELDACGLVQTLAANGIRLASAWDPDAESSLQIAHLPDSNDAITLYGVGMGGLPELLLQRLSPGGTLTVVLMNASLFNTMLDVIEQSDWLQHSAIRLVLASEQTGVAPCRAITTPLLMLAEASAERLRDHLHQALADDLCRQHIAGREALEQTSLVYFPDVDPAVVRRWPHARYAAYTTHQRYKALRERVAHTSLFTSGSVIHPATDLAVRMGATTLYLAGADFGYPFDATHAGSSAFCEPAPATNASGLTITNYAGHTVPTQMNFLSYYRDLEAFIGTEICRGCEFISLGQFSARIAGVSHEVAA